MSHTRAFQFVTADVFTETPFGGNQLAVFPRATGLTEEEMAQIARELNLSETVFVFPPENVAHTRKLRIRTPAMELPFAGHPTIGTAAILSALGEVPKSGAVVFEELSGPVEVVINGSHAKLTAPVVPQLGPDSPPLSQLSRLLSVPEELLGHHTLRSLTASGGVPFLFIPVRNLEALGRVRLDLREWESGLKDSWAPHVYVFTPTGERHFRARMFAPAMGIAEDPATGAAATAFGRYLTETYRTPEGMHSWILDQGVEMGRPSTIELITHIQAGELRKVEVGGKSVLMSRGEFRL